MNGLAITAGSKPIFLANIGREHPIIFAIITVTINVRHTTSATLVVTLSIRSSFAKFAIASVMPVKAATLISEGESIFLGPGTTIQFLAEQLTGRNIRVITNSLAVFNILVNHAPTEVILTGGDYRDNTNTFVGPITNLVLGKLKYNKAFISCNGIYNSSITTYSLEEGESQQIALDNSKNKYLLADNKKFNRADFYIYYDLFNFDTLITDNTIDDEVLSHYKQYVQIMTV